MHEEKSTWVRLGVGCACFCVLFSGWYGIISFVIGPGYAPLALVCATFYWSMGWLMLALIKQDGLKPALVVLLSSFLRLVTPSVISQWFHSRYNIPANAPHLFRNKSNNNVAPPVHVLSSRSG